MKGQGSTGERGVSWAFGIASMSKEEACLRIELPKYEGRETGSNEQEIFLYHMPDLQCEGTGRVAAGDGCTCFPSCLHPLPQSFQISSMSFLVLSHSPYKN